MAVIYVTDNVTSSRASIIEKHIRTEEGLPDVTIEVITTPSGPAYQAKRLPLQMGGLLKAIADQLP